MASKPRIVCVGHTAFDRVFHVPSWPIGSAKVRATAYRESGGGMAANAAVAVAKLGGHAMFWGPAGNDAIADAMADELRACGVDVSGLERIPGATSSHSAILVDDGGERLIVGVRGAVLTAGADWLPIGTLARVDAVLADVRWPTGAERVLRAARERGITTVLDGDVADRHALRSLIRWSDYVVFSAAGLEALAGDANRESLRQALGDFTRLAAVTRGENGLDWISADDPHSIHHLPAYSISRTIDTTGAGDVFHGAFVLAIAEGRPARDALDFARVAAALKCERGGARELPTRAEVEARLARP